MIKTKRWCDPIAKDDGWRILVCRYRPRALPKKEETWDVWFNELGPSETLHAQVYGKPGHKKISWHQYKKRYIREMHKSTPRHIISCLAKLALAGVDITLLCSSACIDPEYCHRTLLKNLIHYENESH